MIIPIRSNRLGPRDAADLMWLWSDSQGDMGLRSSFAPMVARLEVGGRTGGRMMLDVDERQIEAASRERPIRRRLEAIDPRHRRILRIHYGPEQKPRLECFGDLAALALCSPTAARAHARSKTSRSLPDWLGALCGRVAKRQGQPADMVLAFEIRRSADEALTEATAAYRAARGGR